MGSACGSADLVVCIYVSVRLAQNELCSHVHIAHRHAHCICSTNFTNMSRVPRVDVIAVRCRQDAPCSARRSSISWEEGCAYSL